MNKNSFGHSRSAAEVIKAAARTRGAGLRIGVDGRLMGDNFTGIAYYVSGLSRELAQLLPAAEFIWYAPWPIRVPVASPRWSVKLDPRGKIFERARGLWITKHAWMLLRTAALCRQDAIDVFWATDAPFIPLLPRNVRVIALVHDLRYRVVPETQRASTLRMRRMLEKRFARADALFANSQGTADRLRRYLGHSASGVVRPAASSEFHRRDEEEIAEVAKRYGVRRPYLLSVANADATPHKNIERLIKVFLELSREGVLQSHMLVLCGPRSSELLRRFERINANGAPGVKALGYIDSADLPALYSGAEAFVFPSLYEGFGIPVLEARACLTRIVTTDTPELREAGGERAIYVAPDSVGIRNGILKALQTDRPAVTEKLWTWRSSAETLARALAGEGEFNSMSGATPETKDGRVV